MEPRHDPSSAEEPGGREGCPAPLEALLVAREVNRFGVDRIADT